MEPDWQEYKTWLYHVLVWLDFYDIRVNQPQEYFESAFLGGMGILEIAEDLEEEDEEPEEEKE